MLRKYSVIPASQSADRRSMTYFIAGVYREKQVNASIKFRPFRESDMPLDRYYWYGTDGGSPELVISRVTLSIDGQVVEIPPHAYARHGDFAIQGSPLRLLSNGNNVILRYGGSDGAGAYFLDIVTSGRSFVTSKTYTHNPISDRFEQ